MDNPSGLEIRLTMAPALYGSNLSWMLLGFIFIQTYTYSKYSSSDSSLFKLFIYSVLLIELTSTGLEAFIGYKYLVSNWNMPAIVETPPKEFLFQPLFDAILGTMTQCFFAWRIWTFGVVTGPKLRIISKITSSLIFTTSILALACSIAFPILFFRVDSQPELWATTRPVVITWTVSSAIIDIIITLSMIVILRHARSKTKFKQTRSIISHLTRLTIQTGTLTSILALSIVLIFLEEPFGNMHTFPAYLLSKSYALSLLANVNARSYERRQTQINLPIFNTGPSLAFSPPVKTLKLAESFSSTSFTQTADLTSSQGGVAIVAPTIDLVSDSGTDAVNHKENTSSVGTESHSMSQHPHYSSKSH